jgi:hypothetical protein
MKPNKFAAIKYEDRVLIRDAKNRIHRALVTHFEGLLFKAEWVTAEWDAVTGTNQYKDNAAFINALTLMDSNNEIACLGKM